MPQPFLYISILTEFSCNPEWTCDLELNEGKYFVVVNNQRVELTTEIWHSENYLKKLLANGGAPVLICYGLHKLGYGAFEFSLEGTHFKIKTNDSSQIKKIQRLLSSGSFVHKLNAEISEIIFEHPDELGHVNFKITSCSEVQEPSSNMSVVSESTLHAESSNSRKLPSGPSTEVVDKPKLVADALSTGNQPQDSPTQDPYPVTVPKSTPSCDNENAPPSATQADSVPTNQPDEDQKNQIKYDIGIFAHEHDKKKADRIKSHCNSLGYKTCIFDDWVGVGGEPRPKEVLSFIKECLVLFWIASRQHNVRSYMEQYKDVANDIAIESNNSRFVVVIPKECSRYAKKNIVPSELKAYVPIKEDTKIRERIKATVKAAQALTINPTATNDSQNIPTTSGQPTDVPGPSITNIFNIHGSNVGNLVLQRPEESDAKPEGE